MPPVRSASDSNENRSINMNLDSMTKFSSGFFLNALCCKKTVPRTQACDSSREVGRDGWIESRSHTCVRPTLTEKVVFGWVLTASSPKHILDCFHFLPYAVAALKRLEARVFGPTMPHEGFRVLNVQQRQSRWEPQVRPAE